MADIFYLCYIEIENKIVGHLLRVRNSEEPLREL